mgnify:CR=1 FL=1
MNKHIKNLRKGIIPEKVINLMSTNVTKEVIIDVLNYNGFEIVPTYYWRSKGRSKDKVKTKGNKGGLVYVDMPTKLNDLPEFLNDYKGTNLNVKIDSLRDYK